MRWLGRGRATLAWDIEATGLDPWRDEIRMMQFGDEQMGWAMDWRRWGGVAEYVFRNYDGRMSAHNIKYDSTLVELDGIKIPRHLQNDTMPMLHLHDSQGVKALKPAAVRHLGNWARVGQHELKEAMKKQKWTWATVPIDFEPYWKYGALDTVLTARTEAKILPQIAAYTEAYEREMAVTWILMDMEMRGVRVDLDYCERKTYELERERAEVEGRLQGVNPHSSDDVVQALRARGHRFTKKTDKGALVVDEAVLSSFGDPMADDVVRARWLRKMSTTYIGAFAGLSVDGVLHANVRPLGAEKTGRMSIGRPSMQNLPRKKLIRDCIIASEGGKLVLSDYQAQELRVLAHFSNDARLLQAFQDGIDVHVLTAQQAFGLKGEPDGKQRFTAKQAGYSKVYGAGVPTFANTVGLPTREANEFMKRYDQMYPGVKRFISKAIRTVRSRDEGGYGWVQTLGGHRLTVPVKQAYKAVNYIIQGSCADLTKDAMIRCDRAGVGRYMTLPVHDELIFDVPQEEAEEAVRVIEECMEYRELSAPLIVESDVVDRWGEKYPD